MIEDLWTFINERHNIYLQRREKLPSPWTNDSILQQYEFANIFRELDPTTIAIRRVLNKLYHEYKEGRVREEDYVHNQFVNIILYRIFNNRRNTRFGPIHNPTAFYYFVKSCWPIGYPLHLEDLCRGLLSETNLIIYQIKSKNTLQHAFDILLEYTGVNCSLAYDLTCDLRYTDILRHATDVDSWGYINEGAFGGLHRLSLAPTLESIKQLWWDTIDHLSMINNQWIENHLNNIKYPYFELREIITSLRLFNQYESIRLGEEHHVPLF